MRIRKRLVGVGIVILAIGAALLVCKETGVLNRFMGGNSQTESEDDTIPEEVTGEPLKGGKEMAISVSSYLLDGYSWEYTGDDKGLVKVTKKGEEKKNGYAIGTFIIEGNYPGAATCRFSYQKKNENNAVMTASTRQITTVINDNMTLSYFVSEPEQEPEVEYFNSYQELSARAGFKPLRYPGSDFDETAYLLSEDVNYGTMYEADSGVFIVYTTEYDSNIVTKLVFGCETVDVDGVNVTEGSNESDSIYIAKWTYGTKYYSVLYSGYEELEFFEKTVPTLVKSSK
jgi:hypothetical protein